MDNLKNEIEQPKDTIRKLEDDVFILESQKKRVEEEKERWGSLAISVQLNLSRFLKTLKK